MASDAKVKWYTERVARLKEAGLCVQCGKKQMVPNRTRCRPCLDRESQLLVINRGKRKQRNRAIIEEAKSVPCMDCGNSYPTICMDFDHRDPKVKVRSIATRVWQWPEQKLREEIAKCDVVCANCHRLRHWGS